MQGTVRWFDDEKGFGFISPRGQRKKQRDVFVHYLDVEGTGHRTLLEGDKVEFELGEDDKGRTQATSVRRIDAFDEGAVSDAGNTT